MDLPRVSGAESKPRARRSRQAGACTFWMDHGHSRDADAQVDFCFSCRSVSEMVDIFVCAMDFAIWSLTLVLGCGILFTRWARFRGDGRCSPGGGLYVCVMDLTFGR